METPTAYPLAWPPGHPRTARRIQSTFKTSLSRAMADLEDALRLFGKDTGQPIRGVIISSNVTLGEQRPADPGVAVYFEWDGAQRAIPCDRYTKVEDNIRGIYYVLEARRQEMRHGGLSIVRASFQGFKALPAPPGAADWRAALGLDARADLEAAEAAYKALAKAAHPDAPGGSLEAMQALNEARDAARRELRA